MEGTAPLSSLVAAFPAFLEKNHIFIDVWGLDENFGPSVCLGELVISLHTRHVRY